MSWTTRCTVFLWKMFVLWVLESALQTVLKSVLPKGSQKITKSVSVNWVRKLARKPKKDKDKKHCTASAPLVRFLRFRSPIEMCLWSGVPPPLPTATPGCLRPRCFLSSCVRLLLLVFSCLFVGVRSCSPFNDGNKTYKSSLSLQRPGGPGTR